MTVAAPAAPDNSEQAKKILPEVQKMVESDLMKANHYMRKGIQVAIVAGNTPQAENMAKFHVELDDLLKRYSSSFRKLVD